MFREKFILTFCLALIILVAALVAVLLLTHGDWGFWVRNVWFTALLIVAGLDFGLVMYIGWDYLDPTETRLPLYLALAASMLIALIYKGITLLLK